MPIVNGRYEAKISTVFKSVPQAVDEIKSKIRKSRRGRINNIPLDMLKELAPLLAGKDVKIILPAKAEPAAELKELGPTAVTKARIYKDFKGTEAHAGSITFSDRIFNITWVDGKILEIDAMDYDKCVKCLKDMFETGWHYADKGQNE